MQRQYTVVRYTACVVWSQWRAVVVVVVVVVVAAIRGLINYVYAHQTSRCKPIVKLFHFSSTLKIQSVTGLGHIKSGHFGDLSTSTRSDFNPAICLGPI